MMQPPTLRTVMFACRVGPGRATTATILSLRSTWSPMIQSASLPTGGMLPAVPVARLSGVIVTISAAGHGQATERKRRRKRLRRNMFRSSSCSRECFVWNVPTGVDRNHFGQSWTAAYENRQRLPTIQSVGKQFDRRAVLGYFAAPAFTGVDSISKVALLPPLVTVCFSGVLLWSA